MMNFRIVTLLGFFMFFHLILNAQGDIRVFGAVRDKETGDILPGATVVIKGTTRGTVTGLDGKYSLLVPGEKTTLVYSFIGFHSDTIAIGSARNIDVSLNANIETIGEVVVSAQAKGQIGARNQQINSNTIKNVVSSDRLQENPDANAVEAIGRLPGISVIRSGGEGTAIVIRGLEQRYTAVTLNGIKMPASMGSGSETDVSGISQYALQGVEVFKALTPDMEANSVAGSVNFKLKETPDGLHSNVMAMGGYNNMNNYFGNYKMQAEISNRLFNKKLGVFISANAERVNRSTQTMSAGYGLEKSDDVEILLTGASLNNIQTTKYRRSAMISMDYRPHKSTTISLFSIYNYSKDDHNRQTKNYNITGKGDVSYNFHDNPLRNNNIWQSALNGLTRLNFLNMELDYGLAYSTSKMDDPQSRNWNYMYEGASVGHTFTNDDQKLDPSEIIPLFSDNGDSLQNVKLTSFGQYTGKMKEDNLTEYLNIEIPYQLGKGVTGYLKFGATHRTRNRVQDVTNGNQTLIVNDQGKKMLDDKIDWIVRSGLSQEVSAIGLKENKLDNFLDGRYDFGWTYDIGRLNEITDTWVDLSDYYYAQGPEVWQAIFGAKDRFGFGQDISSCIMDDQDIKEQYYASYLMTELNLGKWLMIMPGVRYETTNSSMAGYMALNPSLPDPIYEPIPGSPREADRSDEFLLPMIHLRIKPSPSFYTHLAYTHTLSRPDMNQISPNTFINAGFPPFSYTARNPDILTEFWKNYDGQMTFHGNKIGLVSIGAFYKTVENKIWGRGYTRLKGDPLVEPFGDLDQVNMSVIENHNYPIFIKGLEVEVQTSFWYLHNVLKHFTISTNYTYTDSETQYPFSEKRNIVPAGGGRPVQVRFDSTITGPMLFQPKHIVNASLGFNRKGFNSWLSFQYNGKIFTGYNQLKELYSMKESFYRWDLQLTQKLKKRFTGFEIIGNIANMNDFIEKSRNWGDARPSYLERYGWTFDTGIRYRF